MIPALPALVLCLAIILFIATAIKVGAARGKYGIHAPATSGHPEFERIFRVQQNTLEQLVAFIPSVVRQTDCNLLSRARALTTFARMSEARAVQMNGLGSRL